MHATRSRSPAPPFRRPRPCGKGDNKGGESNGRDRFIPIRRRTDEVGDNGFPALQIHGKDTTGKSKNTQDTGTGKSKNKQDNGKDTTSTGVWDGLGDILPSIRHQANCDSGNIPVSYTHLTLPTKRIV